MNEKQLELLKKIRPHTHIARLLGIDATQLNKKARALDVGKAPSFGLSEGNPRLFDPAYKAAQIEFWNDLVVIATEKLKELEVQNGNKIN